MFSFEIDFMLSGMCLFLLEVYRNNLRDGIVLCMIFQVIP